MSMEERVARLEDLERIRALKHRYAELADRQDVDALVALFTPEAVWDGGEWFGTHRGREEIRRFLRETWRSLTWAMHLVCNGEIDVEPAGGRAQGRWSLLEPATIEGRAVWIAGRYRDRYQKQEGAWLISSCELVPEFITPFEAGWVKDRYGR